MGEETKHTKGRRKSRHSSWEGTLRRSLCFGKRKISKPYSIGEAAKEIPAVAEEVERVREEAQKAHQDVLETLEGIAISTSASIPNAESYMCLATAPSNIVSALGSRLSVESIIPAPQPRLDFPFQQPEPEPEPRQQPLALSRPQSRLESPVQQPKPKHQLPPLKPALSWPQRREPALEGLLYFAVERPYHGGYARHYAYPLRVDLSTAGGLYAGVRVLRGYFAREPRRFFAHFQGHVYHGGGIVVRADPLFQPGYTFRPAVEGIWGRRMRLAWVDAREELFAPALIGLLRDLAETRAAAGADGGRVTLDVMVFVRQVFPRGDEYGAFMDVRRIARGGGGQGESLR